MKSHPLWSWLVPALSVAALATAAPHGDLHEQIARVSAQIRADPRQPSLLMLRAELEREHGEHDAALADLASAEALDPALAGLDLSRGRVLLGAGRDAAAELALDRCLAKEPDLADALLLRARARQHQGRSAAAVEDYDRALSLLREPRPEDFLARADAVLAIGPARATQALAGIDQGLARLGPAVALVLRAIELEVQLGRTDAALARLDGLIRSAPRAEAWIARRADILTSAKRTEEARAAWREVLGRIDALPERIRTARNALELAARANAALLALDGDASGAR